MPSFQDFYFQSSTGRTSIHALKCVPDGKPRAVFTRKKELEDIGLAVPDTVSLLFSLREAGMDVPVDAITVEECADVIAKNFT